MPVSVCYTHLPYTMDNGYKETQWKQTNSSNSPSNPVERSCNWQSGNSRTRCLLWYANSSDAQMFARLKRRWERVGKGVWRRGGGVCAHFLPWMQCICRQSSGQAMPRAHCSLTVDAKQAAFPLSTTHTHPLTQLQQQPVILAFAMPWSGAGAGLGLVRLRTC